MKLKEIDAKLRVNKANGQLNFSLPKKKLSIDQLDQIQKKGIVKVLMEEGN